MLLFMYVISPSNVSQIFFLLLSNSVLFYHFLHSLFFHLRLFSIASMDYYYDTKFIMGHVACTLFVHFEEIVSRVFDQVCLMI